MRKSKFSESQIVAILAEGDSGLPVAQILRKHGISHATYYNLMTLENTAIKDVLGRKL